MGDGFDVVRQRMEDSSKEGVNLCRKSVKHLDQKELKSAKNVLERESGEPAEEPGDPVGKKRDFKTPEDNLPKMMLTVPEVVPFPYADTKLRPEAPPFTPECVSPNPELAYGEQESDTSCFVNVDLKLPLQEEEVLPVDTGLLPEHVKHEADPKEVKDERLKSFSLGDTKQIKKLTPSVDVLDVADEEDPIVAVQPTASIASGETRESPVIERVRIFSPAFFITNKTQIIILVASVVVCLILVIFVLV